MTTGMADPVESLPPALLALASAHGSEVGALAALVLQHRGAAETAAARALVDAYRDPHLPPEGPARRLHVLRLALRRTLEMERQARTVDPHAMAAAAEQLAVSVARASGATEERGLSAQGLLAAMASLPARLRAVVVLHHLLDLGGADLDTVAGSGRRRVEEHLADAEQRLRSSLEDPGLVGSIEEIRDDA